MLRDMKHDFVVVRSANPPAISSELRALERFADREAAEASRDRYQVSDPDAYFVVVPYPENVGPLSPGMPQH